MKGQIPISVLSRYFRVPSRQFIAADYPGRDVLLNSRVTNISNNGVFVSCNNPMPRGSEFEVTFQVPGEKGSVKALCVVRWSTVTAAEEGGPTAAQGMGLEFVKIARKDKKAIEKYIRGFLTNMRAKAEASAKDDPMAPRPDLPED